MNKRKLKILIADDSAMNRELLCEMLDGEYTIDQACNGREAIAKLDGSADDYSLMLLDIVMPEIDGYGVLAHMNNRGWINRVPVIMISSDYRGESVSRAYSLGAADFINRPFDALTVSHRVANTIKLFARQRAMESMVADKVAENSRKSDLMTAILSHIVEFRNGESGPHVLNIKVITTLLLRELADMGKLSEELIRDIPIVCDAAALHDIGKIALPEEVLNKPGRLTEEEFAIIRTHPGTGAEMLSHVPVGSDEPLVRYARDICRWHHERIDGRGYPDGLVGNEIPVYAQVVALADVYDALTADRCYRAAFSHDKAMEMIRAGECGRFDPDLIECLIRISPQLVLLQSGDLYDPRSGELDIEELVARSGELVKSEGLVRAAEADVAKYRFMLDTSDHPVFFYRASPSILSMCDSASRILNCAEAIADPLSETAPLPAAIDRGLLSHVIELSQATPTDRPDFELTVPDPLTQGGELRLVCRTIRLSGDGEYYGFMCRAVSVRRG